jgi:hypothetical protein
MNTMMIQLNVILGVAIIQKMDHAFILLTKQEKQEIVNLFQFLIVTDLLITFSVFLLTAIIVEKEIAFGMKQMIIIIANYTIQIMNIHAITTTTIHYHILHVY